MITPGGKPGRLEQLQHVVAAQHRARRRLPDHRVAHQRRRRRQVAADRREVERRHRVDESLERAVVHLIPHARAADRLLAVELLREVRVEAPEVDQLARRIDLGLERRLRLAEHRRGVERRAPRRREQLRGAEEHGGAIFPRPASPTRARASRGRGDRLLHVLRPGEVPVGEHVLVVVRHHRLRGAPGPDLLAADDERDVERSAAIDLRRAFSSARSGEPGAYERFGSFTGCGTRRMPPNAATVTCCRLRLRVARLPEWESEWSKSVWTYRISL